VLDYGDLSPEVEACANTTINSMFESGEVGELIDAGMSYEEVVQSVINECQRQISGSELVIGSDGEVIVGGNEYVKRTNVILAAVFGTVIGSLLGGTITFLFLKDRME